MYIGLRLSMLVVLVILLVFFINMLRKHKLDLKYCLIWIFSLFGIAAVCVFPPLLDKITLFLGIELPINALFLICIAFLTCVCISLTVVVSRLSDRLRQLTQNIAISEKEHKDTFHTSEN